MKVYSVQKLFGLSMALSSLQNERSPYYSSPPRGDSVVVFYFLYRIGDPMPYFEVPLYEL